MGRFSFTRVALFFFILWAHLRAGYARVKKSRHQHGIFVAAPKRFNRAFLEQYAKKSVEEFNKQSSDKFKYILLDVIGGRANEETKSLELVMKFGRTRCQKTEDRYFCQTTPEMHVEEKLFKVGISKRIRTAKPIKAENTEKPEKDAADSVEFKFEETSISSLPSVQKLFQINTE
ncbi:hypothetical protein M3Y97_00137700 [Aphelenchoides bicaudatus]|nr:hypothetical protein M3Y97_00137700 [Aphelenchoides bicaudatus]